MEFVHVATRTKDLAKAIGFYTEVASVAIVDLTHPENPQTLGYIWTPELASDLAMGDHEAFIIGNEVSPAGESMIWFFLVDLTDPAHTRIARRAQLPGQAEAMAVPGRYAYVAAGYGGLHIVDAAEARLLRTMSANDLRSP